MYPPFHDGVLSRTHFENMFRPLPVNVCVYALLSKVTSLPFFMLNNSWNSCCFFSSLLLSDNNERKHVEH